ncbi:MAG: hypothetical protein KBF43_12485 [Dermatophilaceae bacterium]|nr:hypothetical protein [Dermatophilaceae bacterium]
MFTLPRPAAVLAAPLGPLAAHFVMRALPLAPTTVPKSPDRGLPAAPRASQQLADVVRVGRREEQALGQLRDLDKIVDRRRHPVHRPHSRAEPRQATRPRA